MHGLICNLEAKPSIDDRKQPRIAHGSEKMDHPEDRSRLSTWALMSKGRHACCGAQVCEGTLIS